MKPGVREIINKYDGDAPLAEATTIPESWYTNERLFELEKQTIFSRSWQFAARIDQLNKPGDYVTGEVAGEPIVVVRRPLRPSHNPRACLVDRCAQRIAMSG